MTTMTFRTTIPARRLAALCLVAAAIASASARAQTWPERPITLVSQGAPGGSTDRIKTIVFDRVAIALGKPMVLDSRPGAAGTIAAGYTARAAPDGYTLFLGTSGSLTAAPTVQKNVPYDTLRDFTPITTLIENSLALVVGRSVSARDARELVEAMRREPGRYNYGSWGLGSGNFLAFELFKLMTGTDAVHVPYKGAAPLLQAMLAGDVQVAFMDLPALRPHVEAGTLRILGLAAEGRDPTLPDLPTLTERLLLPGRPGRHPGRDRQPPQRRGPARARRAGSAQAIAGHRQRPRRRHAPGIGGAPRVRARQVEARRRRDRLPAAMSVGR